MGKEVKLKLLVYLAEHFFLFRFLLFKGHSTFKMLELVVCIWVTGRVFDEMILLLFFKSDLSRKINYWIMEFG